MRKNRRKLNIKGKIFILIFVLLVALLILFLVKKVSKNLTSKNSTSVVYICSDKTKVKLYDMDKNEAEEIVRGTEVINYKYEEQVDDKTYTKIKYNGTIYLIDSDNISTEKQDIVKEKEMYVRTNTTTYKDDSSAKIVGLVKKGEKVEIIGYDKLNEDGTVNKYKIKYNDEEAYVYAKYLVYTEAESLEKYDENGLQEYLSKMGDTLGGGTATNLDYYPYEKPKFEDNVMPDEVRAFYINSSAVKNIDKYIELAKESNINAFVIDIKDNTSPAYNSPVMQEYSPTNYNHAINDFETYKQLVKKAKDAGFYVIGRITTFKDNYFVDDHKETAIKGSNGQPFNHNSSYWPTAYNRLVWEFNVELAREAVKEVGFNEIQFDYVRFPDRTQSLEKSGTINLINTYNEEKAQAIQTFVMYAADSIHELGAYVSIDVFGESASNYVTAYGQFWAAISNVADVISGMPYPDHFSTHEYGISEVVWTVPYKLLSAWGSYVAKKQEIIPTPAVVRTWIQTYNSIKTPTVVYDASKVSDEIRALYDNGLTGGYMTWNSASSLEKYREVNAAFKKVY